MASVSTCSACHSAAGLCNARAPRASERTARVLSNFGRLNGLPGRRSAWGSVLLGRQLGKAGRELFHVPASYRSVVVAAAGNSQPDLYSVLGISSSATLKEIKTAYRQKAKKLHPDVNKAPDAQERFLEAKMAYQVLSDATSRADYDRKQRMGSGAAGWGDFDSFFQGAGAASSTGGSARRPEAEDFYGLDDFFRDLDKDLKDVKDGASLFSSLANEFVEFLEEGLEDLDSELKAVSDEFEEVAREARDMYSNYSYDPKTGQGSWGNGQQGSGSSSSDPWSNVKKDIDDDIDATLAEMKKRMGL